MYSYDKSGHHFEFIVGPVLGTFTPPEVAPVSLRNTRLQVMVNVGETVLTPDNPEFEGGSILSLMASGLTLTIP